MRYILVLLAALTATGIVIGQRMRTEVAKPTTPADDAKPNSDRVPAVYAAEGQFDRVLVLRFKYDTDLLAGLEKMVRDNNIRNAVILAGIGSVKSYHVHAVSNRSFPSKNIYVKGPTGAADIVSMNGYVIDGRIHCHMTMADADHSFGGHLEPGTTVFTFAVVTVGVFKKGIDLSRVDDKTYR
jgi:predicted DNA-binding protein with PD1-like motif